MSRAYRVSMAVYRAVQHLYPYEHRQAYGNQMAQTFADMSRAALPQDERTGSANQLGGMAIVKLWLGMLPDIAASLCAEHW